jgi:hypothetical protein
MKPGRDLDRLLAEKVFGWVLDETYRRNPHIRIPDGPEFDLDRKMVLKHHMLAQLEGIPHYSTSIEAAWKVVEKAKPIGFKLERGLTGWFCQIEIPSMLNGKFVAVLSEAYFGVTAAHAICLAALKLVGVEYDSLLSL